MGVGDELKTYLQVLWRYAWLIALCALLAALVAVGISLRLTPQYEATAKVRVASAPGGASDYTYISSLSRLSNTYVEIATSEVSLNLVADRLGLAELPKVEVAVVPETELIEITAKDPTAGLARDIANTLANLMVEQSMQLYGGNAPTAREILEGQLEQAKIDLDTAVAEYDQALRAAEIAPTRTVSGTPLPNPDLETLSHLVYVRQQIYGDLLQKYETARTSEQLRINAITIVEPAILPLKPASPNIPLNGILGIVAGLTAGVIMAFFFEGLDDTLRGIEDVQAMTKLPILCMVPEVKHKPGQNGLLSASNNHHFIPLPAFDQLRARLILVESRPKATVFLITSPEPGTGKSTVAANLASSLTHGGNKVILVDMDLRRPRQHSIWRLENETGVSNFMRDELGLDAILRSTKNPNLRVVPSGPSPTLPLDWLTPERISLLLETLCQDCDYVLIDAPALLSVADPMVLASRADAVILVVARRKTERKHLRFALQQLDELKAKVEGIVVNRTPNTELYRYYARSHTKPKKFALDSFDLDHFRKHPRQPKEENKS